MLHLLCYKVHLLVSFINFIENFDEYVWFPFLSANLVLLNTIFRFSLLYALGQTPIFKHFPSSFWNGMFQLFILVFERTMTVAHPNY